MKNILFSLAFLFMLGAYSETKAQNLSESDSNLNFTLLPYAHAPNTEELPIETDLFKEVNTSQINPKYHERIKQVFAAHDMEVPKGLAKAGVSDIRGYIKSQGNKGGISLFAQRTAYDLLGIAYNTEVRQLLQDVQNRQIAVKDVERVQLALELLVQYENPNADLLLAIAADLKQHGNQEAVNALLQKSIEATEKAIERFQDSDKYRLRAVSIEQALNTIKAL